MDLETIASSLTSLCPSEGDGRHAHTLFPERLHVAKGPNDTYELFLEGAIDEFGLTAVGRALDWGTFHDFASDRRFGALVVRLRIGDDSTRMMAHLAYEAWRVLDAEPEVDCASLVQRVEPFLAMILQRELLSVEQQMGLLGELLLFNELLSHELNRVPTAVGTISLSRWHGWDSASRDFHEGDTAVEVKATRHLSRIHAVHSMRQLLPDVGRPGQVVYVYSIGLQVDRSSDFRLATLVDRVLNRLSGPTHEEFEARLREYCGVGYDRSLSSKYRLEPGFVITQPGALFEIQETTEILRPSSFSAGKPPQRVLGIRYDLSLNGLRPLSRPDTEDVYAKLLGL